MTVHCRIVAQEARLKADGLARLKAKDAAARLKERNAVRFKIAEINGQPKG